MMNNRIKIENQIKALSDSSWFFPSQVNTYQKILPFIGGNHRVINLYGLQGVGKTFLAHILMKEQKANYITSPELFNKSKKPLVVDNAPFERTAVRGIRNHMRRFDLVQVILITRYRVEDTIPAFVISLTPEDVRCFRANLYRHLDLRLPNSSSLNLWEHLKLVGGYHD